MSSQQLLSKATFKELKRTGVEMEEFSTSSSIRKRTVDQAFAGLMQRVLRTAHELETAYADKKRATNKQQQIDEASVEHQAVEDDPNLKKRGSVVVLRSTGQCGVVQEDEKPGKGAWRILVKLDQHDEDQEEEGKNEEEEEYDDVIRVSNLDLYWMKHCKDEADALWQMKKACGMVPQTCDVHRGDRVCLIHLKNQTGVVQQVPKPNTRQTCFLVVLDVSRNEVKCAAENMRLVRPGCTAIGPPFGRVGRPSREARQAEERAHQCQQQRYRPQLVVPRSKSGEAWLRSLRAPKQLPPPPPPTAELEEEQQQPGVITEFIL